MGSGKYYKEKMFYCQTCGKQFDEEFKKQVKDKILRFKILCPGCFEGEKNG